MDKKAEKDKSKTCTRCNLSFPATPEFFHRQKNGKYGLTSKCKLCKLSETESWRQKNLDKHREYKIKWRKENREKYLEAKRLHQRKRKAKTNKNYNENEVLSRYGTDCHLCGDPIDLSAPRSCKYPGWEYGLQIDHVIQLCVDGEDSIDNVKPSHGICNVKKNKRPKISGK